MSLLHNVNYYVLLPLLHITFRGNLQMQSFRHTASAISFPFRCGQGLDRARPCSSRRRSGLSNTHTVSGSRFHCKARFLEIELTMNKNSSLAILLGQVLVVSGACAPCPGHDPAHWHEAVRTYCPKASSHPIAGPERPTGPLPRVRGPGHKTGKAAVTG